MKSTLLSICILIGCSWMTTCDAQSIVGKWKAVSVKNYYSPDYAKQIGKSMDEKFVKDAGNSEIDYRPDHTFILSMSSATGSDVMTMKGVWDVTQDQLKLTLESQYNPKKLTTTATFSIHGNILTTTAIISPPSRIIKTIAIASRD
jgi:hypothetical protein